MITKSIAIPSVLSFFLLISCSSGSVEKQDEYTIHINGVWIDDNTFRISGKGTPSRNASPEELKASAIRSAVHQAQNSTLIQFKEYKKSRTTGTQVKPNRFHTMIVLGAIKKGTIVKDSERFDKRNNCTLLFEVKTKNLKSSILLADIDSIDIIH